MMGFQWSPAKASWVVLFSLSVFRGLCCAQEPVPPRIIDDQTAARLRRGGVAKALEAPLRPIGKGLERILFIIEDRQRQLPGEPKRQGFLPAFGGLSLGSGPNIGAKFFRNDFPIHGVRVETPVQVSTKLYQRYGIDFIVRPDSPFHVDLGAAYLGQPRNSYFGTGNLTTIAGHTSYNLEQRVVYLQPTWRLNPHLSIKGDFRYSDTSIFNGRHIRGIAGVSERAANASVPGLHGARIFSSGLALEHDTRDSLGMPSHGGGEFLNVSWNQGIGKGDFGYWKYQAELFRYFPLLNPHRVLGLRFYGETNRPRGGSHVPFFDQAILGGAPTLRGFREYRFFDRTALLLTAEYRIQLNDWAGFFLFLDEGEVAHRIGDLGGHFHASYGPGMRFGTAKHPILKASVGWSNEGVRFYSQFGPRF